MRVEVLGERLRSRHAACKMRTSSIDRWRWEQGGWEGRGGDLQRDHGLHSNSGCAACGLRCAQCRQRENENGLVYQATCSRVAASPNRFLRLAAMRAFARFASGDRLALDDGDFAVVVAVALVRMVQMAIHQVIDVIAVRHGWVTATGSVYVIGAVAAAGVPAGATVWIGCGDVDAVFFDVACGGLVMKVAIMQIIHMVSVLDGRVSTSWTVDMVVVFVVVSHSDVSLMQGVGLGTDSMDLG